MAAAMMPITAHSSHAGKKAPNSANEGAPASEQPVRAPFMTATSKALSTGCPFVVQCSRRYALERLHTLHNLALFRCSAPRPAQRAPTRAGLFLAAGR